MAPFFHLNTIKLLGIEKKEEYFCFKEVEDTYVALGTNNILTSWDRKNGDLVKTFELKGVDYSGYEIHNNQT